MSSTSTNPTNLLTQNGKTARDRRSILAIGAVTASLAGIHLADHALRGWQVRHHHLDPAWNHSGWPFEDRVTPYTFSLIAFKIVLGACLVYTFRGKLWAGYWLAAAIGLGALVTVVHFLPTEHQESPDVIYSSWPDWPIVGALSVITTFALVVALVSMAANALRVRYRSGTWT